MAIQNVNVVAQTREDAVVEATAHLNRTYPGYHVTGDPVRLSARTGGNGWLMWRVPVALDTHLQRVEPTLTNDGSDLGVALDRALRADIALVDLYHGTTYRKGSAGQRKAGEALNLIREARRILMALDEQRAKKVTK